jgi:putative phosphotransacetylase
MSGMADPKALSEADLERLATLIADSLLRAAGSGSGRSSSEGRRDPWLRPPVRPEPPARGGSPPVWTGAAQTLDGVAPGATRTPSAGRSASVAELTNATRAAAAGRGAPITGAPKGRSVRSGSPRGRKAATIEVGVGVSNRHVHLSEADARALFGTGLTVDRPISQPGQFAAHQTVTIEGPKGRIEGVRVVGPARGATQVELARSDARRLGIDPPVAPSGSLATSIGGVALRGSGGTVRLEKGVIIAGRHLHLSEADSRAWGFADGDVLDVQAGAGARRVTFHGVLVRAGPKYATEIHLDVDEANAAALRTGDRATIVAWASGQPARRTLVTERDVVALARRGESIPRGSLLTPSARDRAKALGLPIP